MKIICPHCSLTENSEAAVRTFSSFGRFWRKSDGQWIRRFWCVRCKKTFSTATLNSNYRQKKRHKNNLVKKLLAGGTSQREIGRILCINRKTVARKLLILGPRAKAELEEKNYLHPKAIEVEFDDLETFEHTKCKPLSVTLFVEYKTRRILDFEISQMPAKGRLAKISLKKYGYRADHRPLGRERLFKRVKPFIADTSIIRSDSNPHYTADVARFFPEAKHATVLGGRGCSTGQGELKKKKFDPIFSLNHTCAMFRANINRLFRKTWCTTKKPERLAYHLALYCVSHNKRISTA